MSELIALLTILFAAAVGSGFYALTTAQRYIRARTFDPQFNQVYVIRFIVGILAGTIIASIMLLDNGVMQDVGLGPAVAAIVGGYSSEVVQQILTRLADAMLTVVKGSPADQMDVAAAQTKANADKKRALEKVETAKLLADIKHDIASVQKGDPARDTALEKLNKAIDSI